MKLLEEKLIYRQLKIDSIYQQLV